jgi:hypothetical protein
MASGSTQAHDGDKTTKSSSNCAFCGDALETDIPSVLAEWFAQCSRCAEHSFADLNVRADYIYLSMEDPFADTTSTAGVEVIGILKTTTPPAAAEAAQPQTCDLEMFEDNFDNEGEDDDDEGLVFEGPAPYDPSTVTFGPILEMVARENERRAAAAAAFTAATAEVMAAMVQRKKALRKKKLAGLAKTPLRAVKVLGKFKRRLKRSLSTKKPKSD